MQGIPCRCISHVSRSLFRNEVLLVEHCRPYIMVKKMVLLVVTLEARYPCRGWHTCSNTVIEWLHATKWRPWSKAGNFETCPVIYADKFDSCSCPISSQSARCCDLFFSTWQDPTSCKTRHVSWVISTLNSQTVIPYHSQVQLLGCDLLVLLTLYITRSNVTQGQENTFTVGIPTTNIHNNRSLPGGSSQPSCCQHQCWPAGGVGCETCDQWAQTVALLLPNSSWSPPGPDWWQQWTSWQPSSGMQQWRLATRLKKAVGFKFKNVKIFKIKLQNTDFSTVVHRPFFWKVNTVIWKLCCTISTFTVAALNCVGCGVNEVWIFPLISWCRYWRKRQPGLRLFHHTLKAQMCTWCILCNDQRVLNLMYRFRISSFCWAERHHKDSICVWTSNLTPRTQFGQHLIASSSIGSTAWAKFVTATSWSRSDLRKNCMCTMWTTQIKAIVLSARSTLLVYAEKVHSYYSRRFSCQLGLATWRSCFPFTPSTQMCSHRPWNR